ncbi:hypothetical protein EDD22DRAFT_1011601 [Suillus occidentalis]|nr:hypothetical protein EDD22DRAFT_1011601 [Suillus occidentalis]
MLSSARDRRNATSSQGAIADSEARVAELEAGLQTANGKKREVEKEQEDILVLLDDMSTKRRRDK